MKNRKGFVSNSSSSSFIVIEGDPLMNFVFEKEDMEIPTVANEITVFDGEYGETQFGWQERRYSDFFSKANFAWLQASYAERQDWKDMLCETIKEFSGAEKVEFSFDAELGHIDHQSIGSPNCEMFESKHKLKCFLFNKRSHINNDNDNH